MEITTDSIKELREMTGVSVMQCKKALLEAGGDVKSYIEDVDALQKWENSNRNSDPVKTVSRVVQSMEVMALESIDSMLSNKTLDGPNMQQHIRFVLLS